MRGTGRGENPRTVRWRCNPVHSGGAVQVGSQKMQGIEKSVQQGRKKELVRKRNTARVQQSCDSGAMAVAGVHKGITVLTKTRRYHKESNRSESKTRKGCREVGCVMGVQACNWRAIGDTGAMGEWDGGASGTHGASG